MSEKTPAITVLGGGTGTSALIKELKKLTPDITAIVTTFDSGGSSGVLRARHGMAAPGDIRRCLAALGSNEEQAKLFNSRLRNGHAVGNLMLSSWTQELGSFDAAVQKAADMLNITGRVLPVSLDASTSLVMRHNGERIRGEYEIGTFPVTDPNAYVYLEPGAKINPKAAEAISQADMVVVAPGSLLTSLDAVLAPNGVDEALKSSKGMLVDVANLEIEKPHALSSWHVADHVLALQSYTGRPFDAVLYNNYHPRMLPGVQLLDTEPGRFDDISAVAIGAPFAIIEGDAVTHDTKLVSEHLGLLLAETLSIPR